MGKLFYLKNACIFYSKLIFLFIAGKFCVVGYRICNQFWTEIPGVIRFKVKQKTRWEITTLFIRPFVSFIAGAEFETWEIIPVCLFPSFYAYVYNNYIKDISHPCVSQIIVNINGTRVVVAWWIIMPAEALRSPIPSPLSLRWFN